jgi:hypothetical protein
MESLVSLVIALIIVGVCLYLIELLPMDATIKTIIRVIIILVVILWLLGMLVGYAPLHLGLH